MSKTYRVEGRQIAYILRGLFIIIGLAIYFSIPGLHWGFFFGILIASVIVAEILGAAWTRKRRKKKNIAISRRIKRQVTQYQGDQPRAVGAMRSY
ncbi:hypothetical protein ACE41H_24935 [Paenibacillus enshidis]|uniref:DUF4229 domain-containing protein n=1 Tax=Paenibacillus enshidis TaxID=1458439 RepID=A0ABV5B0J7_9BACL